MPADLDPRVAQIIEHLLDRVNYLLGRSAPVETNVSARRTGVGTGSQQSVSLAAASDPLLAGSALVGAGDSNFVGQSVPITATGAGITISGPTSAATVSVTNAATLRSAIGVTGVAAHTITLAKITPAGANGSITWDANGWVTAYVDPT